MSKRIKYVLGAIILICLIIIGAIYYQQRVESNATKRAASIASSILKKEDKQAAHKASTHKAKQASAEVTSSSATTSSTAQVDNTGGYDQAKLKQLATLQNDDPDSIQYQFYQWVAVRAQQHNNAVTDWVFEHGSAGSADWYATTPNGLMQVSDQDNPGYNGFKLHMLGGVTCFEAKSGQTGAISEDDLDTSFADGYSSGMDLSQPTYKYLLGDDGVVYEFDNVKTPSDGFGEMASDGTTNGSDAIAPNQSFTVSTDQAAQQELQKLLAPYKK